MLTKLQLKEEEKKNGGGAAAGSCRMIDDDGKAQPGSGVSDIPPSVWNVLAEYQKAGVRFVLEHEGRALIADEPGLGKTIQAIAAASAYRKHEWPLLIIAPSSARYHWEQELNQWLSDREDLQPNEVERWMETKNTKG